MYSKQELNADSNYVVYSALIRAMRDVRPSWHWVIIFPDAQSGFSYEDDGFFALPNLHRVPQRINPRKKANAVSFDTTWYDRMYRSLAFDAVWVNLVEAAGNLRSMGSSSYERVGRPTIVAAHNYVIHETLPYPFHSMENIAAAQVLGALQADSNVFNSDHCQSMFRETAAHFLNEARLADIEATSTRIDYGTLEAGLVPDPKRTPNDVPVFAYNHRLMAYKRFQETFAVLDELHREGLQFRVRYMNNTRDGFAKIAHHPFVELRLCPDRESYLEALRSCDLNVTNSVHETFCIAAIESMALGQPLIAPMGITFPQITGATTGNRYPFLFKSTAEQKQHLRRLITDPELRASWGGVVSKHVRESYNAELWAQRYAELFERLDAPLTINAPEDTTEAGRALLRASSGMPFHEFRKRLYAIRIGGRQPFSNQSWPMSKIQRFVRQLGGRVAFSRKEQVVHA
jgi:glycosyltransferase involved in cell wall biosynthesis